MLMSLWERHECKLFSGVDTACNLSIDQKQPEHAVFQMSSKPKRKRRFSDHGDWFKKKKHP